MDYLRYWIVPLTTLVGVVGFVLGHGWVWLGIATFPVLLALDVLLSEDTASRRIVSGAFADAPLYAHAILMVSLYAAFVMSVGSGLNPLTGPGAALQILGSALSLAWLSAVPTLPVAHELMHRRHWFPRRVSQLLNTFYGDPNRDIGHVRTHHLHLDTHKDSDTPLRGETMYTFVVRATLGSYRDAMELEALRLKKLNRSAWHWSNRGYQQIALLAALPLLSYLFAGLVAALLVVIAVVAAKILVEAFNYFQHYGLIRIEDAPIQKHHAWNHLGAIARPLGVEITNHINHHLDGYTRFYNLQPEPEAPRMPSLFLCFITGLIPPLWFRLIAMPRLRDWDTRFASDREQQLAMEANAKAGWPLWVAGERSEERVAVSSS